MLAPLAHFEKHITITEPQTLAIDILASATGLSKQVLKQAMQKGAVWLSTGARTQRIRRAKRLLQSGDILHLYYNPTILSQQPPKAELICDEGPYSVWNKPSGMWSQGSKWSDHCTISRWAEQHLMPQRPAFIVHRLDRAAQGLLLLAHQKTAAQKFSQLFHDRQIDKRYHIWVHGCFPAEATAEQPILVDTAIDGRSARSTFSLLAYNKENNRSLLAVSIETGRKHQIRRHSASLGFPVVGDRLYGKQMDTEDLQLTAVSMRFQCPFTQTMKYYSLR